MPRITPKLEAGRSQYRVTFANPFFQKKVQAASLQTDDEQIAIAICDDIGRLCERPELWADPHAPALGAFHVRAREIFFKSSVKNTPELGAMDAVERLMRPLLPRLGITAAPAKILIDALRAWQNDERRVLAVALEKSKASEAALRQRVEVLASEVEKYARKNNAHVRVTIGEAVKKWKQEYPQGRKDRTVRESINWVDDFVEKLPKKEATRLSDIRSGEINDWLAGMKALPDKDGKAADISPVTRQHRKTYLSAFFTWAWQRYQLVEHPVRTSMAIAGATSAPEVIDALTQKEIKQLLDALSDNPYWHAWVAVAVLAGPRWGEQVGLTLDAVNFDDNYILIRASKTGRQRRVPIEQTVLRGILVEHVQSRKRLQREGASEADRSQFLFPSAIGDPFRPRTKSPAGKWCSADAWHKCWKERVCLGKEARIWSFGPMQWRHSFGTALGQCGYTSIEIAKMMGNSPLVCERHYVAVSEPGKRWGFKW